MGLTRSSFKPANLRTKFGLLVLLSTLITALVVTAISTHAIHSYLMQRVEQQLPSLLQRTADKVDFWYQQRLHELKVFADSRTLISGMAIQQKEKSDIQSLKEFLYYLLENSPQYRSLYLVDGDKTIVASAGRTLEVLAKKEISTKDMFEIAPGELGLLDQGRVQIAAAAVRDPKQGPGGTLYAVLDPSELTALLVNQDLGGKGVLYLVDSDGNYVAGSQELQGVYERQVSDTSKQAVLEAYRNSKGEEVVGAAIAVPRIAGLLVIEEPYAEAFAPVSRTLGRVAAINLVVVLVFSFIAYHIARSISRPIDALSDGVRRIREGEKNVVIPESSPRDEIGVLTHAFNAMTDRLDQNTKELERLSTTDGLTQLYNYRFFRDYVATEEKRIERSGQPLALIMSDIDNFKQWNDRFGHARGDEILCQIARILKEAVRESDLVARYGGDEFVVLAPNTNLEGALELAEKLRSAVAETEIIADREGNPCNLTISTGVSVYTTDFNALFEDADRALYSAKNAGRNCVRAAGVKG